MCVDVSGLLEVFPSSDIVVVGREEHELLILCRKAGTFAFDQVSDEAVVAAVPLQRGPAGSVKERRIRRLLQVEQAVAGLVVCLRRNGSVLFEDSPDDVGEQCRNVLRPPDVFGRRELHAVIVIGRQMGIIADIFTDGI